MEQKLIDKEIPIKPLHRMLVARQLEGNNKTASGRLFIPDSAIVPPNRARVLRLSDEFNRQEDPWLRPGDIISYNKARANHFTWEGQDYVLLSTEAVLAID